MGVALVLPQAKYDAPSHYSIIYVAKPVEIVSGGSVLLGSWGALGWNPFCMLGHVYGMLGHVWTPSTPAFANHPCMFWILMMHQVILHVCFQFEMTQVIPHVCFPFEMTQVIIVSNNLRNHTSRFSIFMMAQANIQICHAENVC